MPVDWYRRFVPLRRIIFEQNQADLEHATEELSGYLERDFSQSNGNLSETKQKPQEKGGCAARDASQGNASLTEMKQKVQDKYRYCSTRRKVLLDHVAEGYEHDYWLVTLISGF